MAVGDEQREWMLPLLSDPTTKEACIVVKIGLSGVVFAR